MDGLINALFDWGFTSPWAQYFSIAITVAYVLSHVVQYLPAKWTAKIPDVVMVVVNAIAAKHGAEKAAVTDIKGNIK